MTNTTLPRQLVRVAAALAIVAAPLALAGCSATPAASTQDSTSAVSLGSRWGDCMRDAGFDVEDPSDDQVRSGTVVAPPASTGNASTAPRSTAVPSSA